MSHMKEGIAPHTRILRDCLFAKSFLMEPRPKDNEDDDWPSVADTEYDVFFYKETLSRKMT